MRILFIGDVISKPGRAAVRAVLPQWRSEHHIDFVLANGENIAGGSGITPTTAHELLTGGVDVLTTGNHVWSQREALTYLASAPKVIRPVNFPVGAPGRGTLLLEIRSQTSTEPVPVLIINALGRLFMTALDDPFRRIDETLREQGSRTDPGHHIGDETVRPRIVIVDFHAEATSEKRAMGFFLDGRVSLVVGTHTHVPTADASLLPKGTAYVTDLGMVGPLYSVIGMDPEPIIQRFMTGLPHRYGVADGPVQVNAVLVDIDDQTGAALAIRRLDHVVQV